MGSRYSPSPPGFEPWILKFDGVIDASLQEMFRRMAFGVVARNQDDHTRNFAFLMDRDVVWRLSPAFDVVWAYNSSQKKTGAGDDSSPRFVSLVTLRSHLPGGQVFLLLRGQRIDLDPHAG